MYPVLHRILSDRSDGTLFRCFGPWHLGYIALFLFLAIFTLFLLRSKSSDIKERTTRRFLHLACGIYLSNFFLMPLAYGEIDIEKLPFHICTAMCVMSFLSYRIVFLKKHRISFAALGFLSNLGYLIYPAGLMWHQTHPLSYRVLDTLFFHGLMSIYGLLVLVYEAKPTAFRTWYRDLAVIVCMVLWALLGNYCYNGDYGQTPHFFNWFFVVRDPFYLLPESVARFVMPLFNTALFFAAEMLVYLVAFLAKRPSRTKAGG